MKSRPSFLRVPGALVWTAFLAIVLGIAVQGAFATRANIARTFDQQSRIVQAQLDLEEILRLQIDEENSVRGYVLTRDPSYAVSYARQYSETAQAFDEKVEAVARVLAEQHLTAASQTLEDYVSLQSNWRRKIAAPLFASPHTDVGGLDKENKAFSDYENRTAAFIRSELAKQSDALARSTQEQINRDTYARAFWLALFGLLAILFNGFRSRLSSELEEERTTTEILQRAFRSEHVPLPNCEVGSAYLSASSHLAVGGDVFDVYRLSDSLAMVFIADVSGKGVDAAVLTAFIKFTIRGIALRRRDPGSMLAEFNTAFAQTVENPYLFVSMFVGVLDTQALQFRYASAGHDSAFVRRAHDVQQLQVTGPVLGVMEEPFETKTLYLEDGDTLVLVTDGLTEARSRKGEQLGERGAMDLIGSSNPQPQKLADELVAQVKALEGNHTRDDLAVLAIRVHEPGGFDAN
ncbi:MAG TPA: SpoIIE family protein phosphatase [Candidatus Acidoferrales bacterium]|nr:SpoIIE family protein phosphatase [Candidatus Acidoferrales bacterium]